MAGPLPDATRELGERVCPRRKELGLRQEAPAKHRGVHRTFLGQIERGRRNLSLHDLLKVAQRLDVEPAELVRALKPLAKQADER